MTSTVTPTKIAMVSRTRELQWWQLWSRAWSQYEIHLSMYRTRLKQPGNTDASRPSPSDPPSG